MAEPDILARAVIHFRSGKTMEGFVTYETVTWFHLSLQGQVYVIPWTAIEWIKYPAK